MRFTLVPRPFRWLFRRIGLAGITMPWQTVYHMPEHWLNDSLRHHEAVHIEQIRRDGAFMFSVKYLWWLAIYGYRENPYERDAYQKAPITAMET